MSITDAKHFQNSTKKKKPLKIEVVFSFEIIFLFCKEFSSPFHRKIKFRNQLILISGSHSKWKCYAFQSWEKETVVSALVLLVKIFIKTFLFWQLIKFLVFLLFNISQFWFFFLLFNFFSLMIKVCEKDFF